MNARRSWCGDQRPPASAADPAAGGLFGLAISGGGIRSATFSLGILQALAELRLLSRIDYLSTVSGGGYIGSWLTAYLREHFQDGRSPGADAGSSQPEGGAGAESGAPSSGSGAGAWESFQAELAPRHSPGQDHESTPVRWLRQYGNYLAPRTALFSADIWSIVTLWLRNTILNQLVLACALGCALLLPRLLWAFLDPTPLNLADRAWLTAALGAPLAVLSVAFWRRSGFPARSLLAMGALAALIVTALQPGLGRFVPAGEELSGWLLFVLSGAGFTAVTRWAAARTKALAADRKESGPGSQLAAVGWVLVAFVSAWLAMLAFWRGSFSMPKVWASAVVLFALQTWVARAGLSGADHKHWWRRRVRPLLAALVGVGVLLGVGAGCIAAFRSWAEQPEGGAVHTAIWGAPLILTALSVLVIIVIGMMGRDMSDLVREWWGRFGAWLTIMGVATAALACVSLYGPLWVLWLAGSASFGGGAVLGWAASTIGGVVGGRSPDTSGGGGAKAKVVEVLLPFAPVVFVAGLLLLLAAGLDQLGYLSRKGCPFPGNEPKQSRLAKTEGRAEIWTALRSTSLWSAAGRQSLAYTPMGDSFDSWKTLRRSYYSRLDEQSPAQTAVLFAALAMIGLILGLSVDINQFSMHNFYRNRLVRCYLGAARARKRDADPFINFDPRDDQPLADFGPEKDSGLPYLLINTALNLSSPELGQQERKAASFVLSPLHCGFFPGGSGEGAFRPTSLYAGRGGGVTLGQAFTISGAAASPNMGFHTSAPVAFLMTVFNVRLGWWLPNPARDQWTSGGPALGFLQLTEELLALAGDKTDYVYLSDGGHFENLGLYELLRRRCRYIICADGEEDRVFQFESLGGLVRKARADFGIEIEIHTASISNRDARGRSGSHCVTGTIQYRDGSKGTLLYLKASVTGDEPADIIQYQESHREFPHQTTGDQFFSESQFESYRRLGYHVGREAFRPVLADTGRLPGLAPGSAGLDIDLGQVFLRLRQTWRSGEKWSKETFTKHTERLDSLLERLRTDPDLRFLDRQIYPQWSQIRPGQTGPAGPPAGPATEEAFAKAFYFCLSLIQIMEDVYLELDLEASYDSPDLRGWTNLFRHWTGSGMFRLTYSIAACTFGGQFQSFCERLLGMKTGAVRIGAADEARWNFYERTLIDGLTQATPEGAETLPILMETVDAAMKPLDLTVGFVVVRAGQLFWIRVQNHLRKMGLARAALEELRRKGVARRLAPEPGDARPVWWERDSKDCVQWVERILANPARPPDRPGRAT